MKRDGISAGEPNLDIWGGKGKKKIMAVHYSVSVIKYITTKNINLT